MRKVVQSTMIQFDKTDEMYRALKGSCYHFFKNRSIGSEEAYWENRFTGTILLVNSYFNTVEPISTYWDVYQGGLV